MNWTNFFIGAASGLLFLLLLLGLVWLLAYLLDNFGTLTLGLFFVLMVVLTTGLTYGLIGG